MNQKDTLNRSGGSLITLIFGSFDWLRHHVPKGIPPQCPLPREVRDSIGADIVGYDNDFERIRGRDVSRRRLNYIDDLIRNMDTNRASQSLELMRYKLSLIKWMSGKRAKLGDSFECAFLDGLERWNRARNTTTTQNSSPSLLLTCSPQA